MIINEYDLRILLHKQSSRVKRTKVCSNKLPFLSALSDFDYAIFIAYRILCWTWILSSLIIVRCYLH